MLQSECYVLNVQHILFTDSLVVVYRVMLLLMLIVCFYFQGDDFTGFEAERKNSKGRLWSRQNPSKGKEKYIVASHNMNSVINDEHTSSSLN